MGRVQLRNTNLKSHTSREDVSENIDPSKRKKTNPRRLKENIVTENIEPSKCKKANPRRLKENVTVGLRKSNLTLTTDKENSRCALSDKTNSTVNEISSEKKSILTENCNNLPKKQIKSKNNIKSTKKPLTFTAPTEKRISEERTVVGNEISDNTLSNKGNKHVVVVPIYKQGQSPYFPTKKTSLPAEEKLAMYEFDEIDDSGETTAVKKKRKKRKYNQKKRYKIGPKYLTINNIKFSSSESIDSLTDKPLKRKSCRLPLNRQQKETAVKRQSQSMINLNDTTNTCLSVASYRSQPLSQTPCTESDHFHVDLSTINENEHSRISQDKVLDANSFTDVHIQNTISPPHISGSKHLSNLNNDNNTYLVQEIKQKNAEDIRSSTPCKAKSSLKEICSSVKVVERDEILTSDDEFHGFDQSVSQGEVLNTDSVTNSIFLSHISNSKSVSNLSNVNNTYLLQEMNRQNLEDIHSSTPCKAKSSALKHICSNEKFVGRDRILTSDDEFHGFDESVRINEQFQDDSNFGFDDEGLEEPLLSPIKKPDYNCNVLPDAVRNNREAPLVLSVQEIVQLLQAEQKEEETINSVIEESTEEVTAATDTNITFTTVDADNIANSFTKPPRRSYQRHPTHRYSFVEYETSDNEDYTVKESKPHRKRKPKVKGKKEEAEADKLAEMLNSKFQEIDKFSLCVE